MSLKLSRSVNMNVSQELRFSEPYTEVDYKRTGLVLAFKAYRFLSIDATFCEIASISDNAIKIENRPGFNLTLKYSFGSLSISDRNRFEYRDIRSTGQSGRYRNRVSLNYNFTELGFPLTAYAKEEIFMDTDNGRKVRCRIYSGFTVKSGDSLTFDMFYLRQRDFKEGNDVDIDVIGTGLTLKL